MKLSLNDLKDRSEATASRELMESISGGLQYECHCDYLIINTRPI